MKKAILQAWKLYKIFAVIIATVFIIYIIAMTVWYFSEPRSGFFSAELPSGFVYTYDMQDGRESGGYRLADKTGKTVIYSDVINFMEAGDIIYGYRKDLNQNPFYFICKYGDDCRASQHLTDAMLREIIEKKRLPLYSSSSSTGYFDLAKKDKK